MFKDEYGNGATTVEILIGVTIAVGLAVVLAIFVDFLSTNLSKDYEILHYDKATMDAIKGGQA